MTEQAADECATLPREAREETFADEDSGLREAFLEQRYEYAIPEAVPVERATSGGEQEPSSTEPNRTPDEQDAVDRERDADVARPDTRSALGAILAEIGRWRADVLK
ncbi:hypothetical protein [Actinopolyspora saharensis]|uniref:Uncharacterized protein n=1 Tax=Actinopolyspora saharensis TaxID=995062 RepID=A0A1H1AJK9_9ACTN|nr:hypothetical protein [Actinopolyspora saharensis]SDQ39834.1 hypothetical protein SAMN04489718_1610 [Actinopolyspora saharensis]